MIDLLYLQHNHYCRSDKLQVMHHHIFKNQILFKMENISKSIFTYIPLLIEGHKESILKKGNQQLQIPSLNRTKRAFLFKVKSKDIL